MVDNNIVDKLNLLFKDFEVFNIKNVPLIKGNLSQQLMNEVYALVSEGYKVKNNPLGFLKSSFNEVNKFSFTSSINSQIFINSYLFPFLNYVGGYFLSKFKNKPTLKYLQGVHLREYPHSVYGDWDIWINFATKNHQSIKHSHQGTMSGIIYVQNTESSPTCFENGYKHYGKPGEILLFPSSLFHWVESISGKDERITIAFNIDDHNE